MSSSINRLIQAQVGTAKATPSHSHHQQMSTSFATSSSVSDSDSNSDNGPVATDDGFATDVDVAIAYARKLERAQQVVNDLAGLVDLDAHHLTQHIQHAHRCNNNATSSNTTMSLSSQTLGVCSCFVGMRLPADETIVPKRSRLRLSRHRSIISNPRQTPLPYQAKNILSRPSNIRVFTTPVDKSVGTTREGAMSLHDLNKQPAVRNIDKVGNETLQKKDNECIHVQSQSLPRKMRSHRKDNP